MLTKKRIGQIASTMVIEIGTRQKIGIMPLSENNQIISLSTSFGLTIEEARKFYNSYTALNRTKIVLGHDDKDNATFENLQQKNEDEKTLGELSIKLLERKIYLEGMGVTPEGAKRLISLNAEHAGITPLEAALFEKHFFEYFYQSVMQEIDSYIIFETGKEIVEYSKKY